MFSRVFVFFKRGPPSREKARKYCRRPRLFRLRTSNVPKRTSCRVAINRKDIVALTRPLRTERGREVVGNVEVEL